MKKVYFILVLVALLLPQLASARVYIPDCISSQKAVFNPENQTVTVSGIVPTKTEYDWETYEQFDLPYVSYILIERHVVNTPWPDEEYARVESPKMGELFEFVDKNISLDCKYEYRLTCYVDAQKGASAFASVYTGVIPGEVTDLILSVADAKATSISMSMNAPLKSDKDFDLTGVMAIEIQQYEDWTYTTVHTIENVSPGEKCTWEHSGLTLNKEYEYRIITRIGENGYSSGSSASIFVGLDYPGTPENFVCKSLGSSVELSWDIPKAGGRNGYFNPESTTYSLSRVYLDGQKEVVVENLNKTEYVDTPDFSEERTLKYILIAKNEVGSCMQEAVSELVVVGKPSMLPFSESFAGGLLKHLGWMTETTQDDPNYTYEAWEFVDSSKMFYFPTDEFLTIEPQDNDKGFASCKFFSYSKDGQTESLISPHIEVSGQETVELSFCYWEVIAEASKNQICVYISKDDGEWKSLYLSADPDVETQPHWKNVTVPVELNKSVQTIRLKLSAVRHEGPITNVFLDNIVVKAGKKSSIETVPVDDVNNEIEYYNLQGIKVDNPTVPGIYIKCCGKQVEKILVQ